MISIGFRTCRIPGAAWCTGPRDDACHNAKDGFPAYVDVIPTDCFWLTAGFRTRKSDDRFLPILLKNSLLADA